MKSLKKIRFAALFAALAIAVVGCSHSAGGGDGDDGHSHAYSSEWKSNDTSHWKECSCGEKSEAASHTEGNWTEVTPATETDDGEEKTTCTVCGKEYTRVIPALGHSHAYSSEWKSNDTSHWKECSCGEKSEAASHTEGNWTEVTPATETDDGEEKTTCTVCGKEYTRVIPALGHSHAYSSEWKSNDTSHWKECSCGEKSEVASHTEGTWQVETPATVTSTGVEKTTCTVCSKELTREIAQLDIGVLLNNKIIGTTECLKTSEVEIIPTGTTVAVSMADDSSWSGYVAESADAYYKGVYIKDRSVTLSPFAMGKYEVTQELYKAVLESDADCNATPSNFSSSPADGETQEKRPVERVTWYDAVYFCNALTKLTMSEADCVYTITDITRNTNNKNKSITSATVTQDLKKKGYRLPTEAEWEFAARGGDAAKPEWNYAFSGVNVAEGNMVYNGSTYLNADTNLNDYAWYASNSGSKTHEVGLKKANTLGIYDMSGNVWEWCWDWYSSTVSTDAVTDPAGPASGSCRLSRGGSWYNLAYYCAVSIRDFNYPFLCDSRLGFRLARSL